MKFTEFIELLFIGLGNLIYNLGLVIYENLKYGFRSWWFPLRLEYTKQYLFTAVRRTVLRESESQKYPRDNFIYGETPCITIEKILENIEYEPGDLFVDLGCGRGLTLFYAHYLGKLKCTGYELLPFFVRRARAIKKNLKTDEVKIFEQDILKADVSKAKIIYIAGTTFSDEFVVKMNHKLLEAPPGAVIVTLSYFLPESHFSHFREQVLMFSWGKTHVFYHRRKEESEIEEAMEEELNKPGTKQKKKKKSRRKK